MRASFTLLTAVIALAAVSSASAREKLFVQSPTPIQKGVAIETSIKTECVIDKKVAESVRNSALSDFDAVASRTLSDAGAAKALSLTVTNVQGGSGGVWTGPKGIQVHGVLKQGGKVIGSFDAARYSGGGGYWSGRKFSSTCGLFDNSAKEIGEDVAAWLRQPGANSKLGDLK